MTLLADVVRASSEVAATSSRSAKIVTLADLLKRLDPDEVPIVVGFLSGSPRQGKVGVGWSTVYKIECEPAQRPSVEIADLDDAITRVQSTTGPGSAAKRGVVLKGILCRATEAEAD